MSYQFKTDDGEVVSVSFEEMMEAEDGFLKLPDGRWARRINRPSSKTVIKCEEGQPPKIVSDTLGFPIHQLEEMREHLKGSGLGGINFRPDPRVKEFVQVECDSERAKMAYAKSRGFFDQNNNTVGSAISPEILEKTRKRLLT